jgi:Ca2+-transporting ATPase
MQSETARTLRSGKWVHDFPARELVPGDLIELRTGRAVQVDRFKTGVERALGFSAWN